MNWDERQHDALDELLQAARWPELPPENIDRVQRQWQRVVQRRKRRISVALVAAALIPVAGIAAVLMVLVARPPDELDQRPMDAKRAIASDRRSGTGDEEAAIAQPGVLSMPERQSVRDPNTYEQTVALVHRSQIGARSLRAPQPEPRGDVVGQMVQRVVDDPALDIAAAAGDLLAACPDCESRLRPLVQRWARAVRQRRREPGVAQDCRAALRLLARVATQDSLSVLVDAANEGDCPPEVFPSIARLSSVGQLAALVRQETIADRRRIWMTALLSRGSSQAVVAYLEFVGDPSTSAAALDAAKSVEKPPVDELFSALLSSRVATRLAAARVLGALNDPTVSKRLAEMVRENVGRREALVALLSSSDPQAKAFLAQAQEDLALAPSVRALVSRFLPPHSTN